MLDSTDTNASRDTDMSDRKCFGVKVTYDVATMGVYNGVTASTYDGGGDCL